MTKREIRIIFAGGGTGGHLFPAIYMAQYLKKHWGANCMFIGSKKGLEYRKVPQAGFLLKFIWISGFHRRLDIRNIIFPLKVVLSLWKSKREIKAFKPDIVIGTGGYVSGPVLYQAAKMKVPTLIQEQNSYPGVTTRLLASRVDHIVLAYEEAIQHLNGVKNYSLIGNPVRNNLGYADRVIASQFFGLRRGMPVVLIFGGSQGSRNINSAIDALIDKGVFINVQLIWQTGEIEFEKYKSKYELKNTKDIHILPFIDKMEYAYAVSHLAICRAGAMTIAELAAVGLPAILVPLPSAAANHQYKNAKSLEEKGAAILVADDTNLFSELENAVQKLKSNRKLQNTMRNKLKRFHTPDAIEQIAGKINMLLEDKQ